MIGKAVVKKTIKPKASHPWRVWVPKKEAERFTPKNRIVPQDRMGLGV